MSPSVVRTGHVSVQSSVDSHLFAGYYPLSFRLSIEGCILVLHSLLCDTLHFSLVGAPL
jgi:hypothetical protein